MTKNLFYVSILLGCLPILWLLGGAPADSKYDIDFQTTGGLIDDKYDIRLWPALLRKWGFLRRWGYAWPLSWAGRYTRAEMMSNLDYFNSGRNVAVPCAVLDALAVDPVPGQIDGNKGPVVPSNKETWKLIIFGNRKVAVQGQVLFAQAASQRYPAITSPS